MVFSGISSEVVDSVQNFIKRKRDFWLRKTSTGFLLGNTKYEPLEGVIIDLSPGARKWEDQKPHRIELESFDDNIPDGYKKSLNLKIQIDSKICGLSLDDEPELYKFSEYMNSIKNMGVRLDRVETRIYVDNSDGSQQIQFKFIRKLKSKKR